MLGQRTSYNGEGTTDVVHNPAPLSFRGSLPQSSILFITPLQFLLENYRINLFRRTSEDDPNPSHAPGSPDDSPAQGVPNVVHVGDPNVLRVPQGVCLTYEACSSQLMKLNLGHRPQCLLQRVSLKNCSRKLYGMHKPMQNIYFVHSPWYADTGRARYVAVFFIIPNSSPVTMH